MFIRFIYVENYEDILVNQSIDFKSKYRYVYNNNEIICSKNNNYIEELYKESGKIDDIIAIVGKNTSGKSTILRLINIIECSLYNINDKRIDEDKKLSYLVIFEHEEQLFCYNRLYDKREIYFKGEANIINKIRMANENMQLFLKNKEVTKYIYYSSIFDKNSSMKEQSNFIDISTNNEIRKSIHSTYQTRLRRINSKISDSNNSEMIDVDYYTEQLDFIEEFRKSEIIKIMELYNQMTKSEFDLDELLFDFPNKLYIGFTDNFSNKDFYLKNIINVEYYDTIKEFVELIEIYSLYEYYHYELVDQKEYIMLILSLLVFFEIIVVLENEHSIYLKNVIDDFLEYADNNKLSSDGVEKYINKILKRKVSVISDEDKDYIEIDSEEFIYNRVLTNQVDSVVEKLDEIEEASMYNVATEYLNSLELIVNELIRLTNDIKEINYLNINNRIRIDDTYVECVSTESLKSFDEICYLSDEDIKNIISYLEKVSEEIRVIDHTDCDNKITNAYCAGIIYNLKDILNKLICKICYSDSNCYIRDINNRRTRKIDYFETNEEVIAYVLNSLKLISLFKELVRDNNVRIENEALVVETNWGSSDSIQFIKQFEKLKITTFKLEFQNEKLSSGQIAYLETQSRIFDLIKNKKITEKDKNLILMIDEADIYLHPGVQISYLNDIFRFIDKFININGVKVQIILTSNSPFIISDIPNSKIIYLSNESQNIEVLENEKINSLRTFGTSINELLIDTFFMDDGIVGKYAQNCISTIIKILLDDSSEYEYNYGKKDIFKIINSIGNSIIREKLMQMYYKKYGNNKEAVKDTIEYYKNIIKRLEQGLK